MRRIAIAALPLLLLGTNALAALPPPTIGAPVPTEPSVLEVSSLEVEVDCAELGHTGLDCRVIAIYSIVNPTDQTVKVALMFAGWQPRELRIDGTALELPEATLDLSVDAHATRRLTVTTQIKLRPSRMNMFLAFEPTRVRHMVFGGSFGSGYVPGLQLPVVAERAWARVGDASFTARYPMSWGRLSRWTHSDESDRRVATRKGPATRSAHFGPRKPTPTWRLVNGGPFAEVGGTFDVGVRVRLGYEVGLRSWLLTSINIGSDLDEDLIVTPLVELASPSVLFLPSFGVGLGAPVRLRPDVAVGIRAQLVATWPIGFVTTFDYWPGDDLWRTTLSARIGI